jgi:hypothetical protein
METKILLKLIKEDISHLQGILEELMVDAPSSSDEVELALARANTLVRQLELLRKLTLESKNTSAKVVAAVPSPEKITGYDHFQSKPSGSDDKVVNSDEQVIAPEIEKSAVPVFMETPKRPLESVDIVHPVIPAITVPSEVLFEDKSAAEKKTEDDTNGESHQLVTDILSQEKSESGYKIIPIKSIRDGIGINDRYLFVRELFENNSSKFDTTVTAIDGLTTIQDAVSYLKMNFKWHKSEASQKFLVLVKRRFTT